ncbi:MAG: hypothetical protein HY540_07655 [Deltaproteobacteria bacterium]|nr:hypothetical protein [Deltaproteobacteria bacterium]
MVIRLPTNLGLATLGQQINTVLTFVAAPNVASCAQYLADQRNHLGRLAVGAHNVNVGSRDAVLEFRDDLRQQVRNNGTFVRQLEDAFQVPGKALRVLHAAHRQDIHTVDVAALAAVGLMTHEEGRKHISMALQKIYEGRKEMSRMVYADRIPRVERMINWGLFDIASGAAGVMMAAGAAFMMDPGEIQSYTALIGLPLAGFGGGLCGSRYARHRDRLLWESEQSESMGFGFVSAWQQELYAQRSALSRDMLTFVY